MKNVIDFILENWQLIAHAVIALVSVIFFILKKKPNQIIDSVAEGILKFLPHALNLAELTALKGVAKKEYCINLIREWARQHSIELTDYYIDFASKQIELILSTPQKKEDK